MPLNNFLFHRSLLRVFSEISSTFFCLCSSNVPSFCFADLEIGSPESFHHPLLGEEKLDVDLVVLLAIILLGSLPKEKVPLNESRKTHPPPENREYVLFLLCSIGGRTNDMDPEKISPMRLENDGHAKYNKPRLTAHRAAFHDETCMMGSSSDKRLA